MRLRHDLRPWRARWSSAAAQFTTAQKPVFSRPTPPRQISNPVKMLLRYQADWMVGLPLPSTRLATASLMNALRSNESALVGCLLTYEMQGRVPLSPNQTSQVPATPGMVTAGYRTRPMGCASVGSYSHTIRNPPVGPPDVGSPVARVLNQTS